MARRTISPTLTATIILLVILAIAGFALYLYACEDDWCFMFGWQKVRATKSFGECEARGFPVMESYPRQCRAGDKTFVEELPRTS